MSRRQGLGRAGEQLAARMLAGKGYQILDSNWRFGAEGEIDLVAQDGDCLVVVEVRTRRGLAYGTPEESVTPRKQARMVLLAEAYAADHDWLGPVRIDVVGVHLSGDGRVLEVNHVQNAING